jgi:hypothetical protein
MTQLTLLLDKYKTYNLSSKQDQEIKTYLTFICKLVVHNADLLFIPLDELNSAIIWLSLRKIYPRDTRQEVGTDETSPKYGFSINKNADLKQRKGLKGLYNYFKAISIEASFNSTKIKLAKNQIKKYLIENYPLENLKNLSKSYP